MYTFLASLFIITSILLIIVVLLQKGRGGGLGAAFGGLGSSAFGTRVGDVFTWVTIVLTAAFLTLAIVTTMWFHTDPGTVAAVSFTPQPGKFIERLRVSLQCPTPGNEIYYTTDGSQPDKESKLYVAPIRVNPGEKGVIVKARAFRGNWNPSEIAEGYYGPNPPPPPAPEKPTDEAETKPADSQDKPE